WVEVASSFGFAGFFLVLTVVGLWIFLHPELHTAALAVVPWVLGVLLTIKVAVAALFVYGLLHWRLTTVRVANLITATWLVLVISLCALTFALLPPALAPATQVIPGISLFVPFARLVGAPLALHWNRHR